MPCSQPASITHGMSNWDGRSTISRFACYQGYHLVGPPQLECRYGQWYPTTYPICKPIVCNQVWSLSTVEVSRQLLTNDFNQVRFFAHDSPPLADFEFPATRYFKISRLRQLPAAGKVVCKVPEGIQTSLAHRSHPTMAHQGRY